MMMMWQSPIYFYPVASAISTTIYYCVCMWSPDPTSMLHSHISIPYSNMDVGDGAVYNLGGGDVVRESEFVVGGAYYNEGDAKQQPKSQNWKTRKGKLLTLSLAIKHLGVINQLIKKCNGCHSRSQTNKVMWELIQNIISHMLRIWLMSIWWIYY